jgi:hypothetical protein
MKKLIILFLFFNCFSLSNMFGIVAIDSLKVGDCSQIVLKNSDIIQADVLKMTSEDIKYKPCGDPKSSIKTVSKNDIMFVKAPNGSIAYSNENSAVKKYTEKKINQNAIIGFILSLAIFGIGSIPALIFSIKGYNQIKDDPQKYEGKELAIGGIVLSILGIIVLLIYAAAIAILLLGG